MSNEISIDIKRTGFPVKVGEVELWFDSSMENLLRFLNVEEIAQKKLKEVQEKAKHIHFPEDVENMDVSDLDVKTIDAAFDVNKEFIAAQYDIIFGDGTFKKVYKKYPDVAALEEAFDSIGVAILKRVEELEVERSEQVEAKKSEYLNKKAKKM